MLGRGTLKDICPKCHELKPMRELSYGKYKTICKQCEHDVKHYRENPFYFILVTICIFITIIMFMVIDRQSDQIYGLKADVAELKKLTTLLK